jgi:uncharacterized protein YneF (UPF0154 family)
MWDIIIPIVTLLVGLVGGFFIGIYYLKRQMTNMKMDDKQLQAMAKSMGMNLNPKQMAQASKMMKNMNNKKSPRTK